MTIIDNEKTVEEFYKAHPLIAEDLEDLIDIVKEHTNLRDILSFYPDHSFKAAEVIIKLYKDLDIKACFKDEILTIQSIRYQSKDYFF